MDGFFEKHSVLPWDEGTASIHGAAKEKNKSFLMVQRDESSSAGDAGGGETSGKTGTTRRQIPEDPAAAAVREKNRLLVPPASATEDGADPLLEKALTIVNTIVDGPLTTPAVPSGAIPFTTVALPAALESTTPPAFFQTGSATSSSQSLRTTAATHLSALKTSIAQLTESASSADDFLIQLELLQSSVKAMSGARGQAQAEEDPTTTTYTSGFRTKSTSGRILLKCPTLPSTSWRVGGDAGREGDFTYLGLWGRPGEVHKLTMWAFR